jgi:hypothetical protein
MMLATATLLSLPVDVLLTIRDAISTAPFTSLDPGLALLAHLSLSQTCRGLRDLYTFSTRESEDLFWKRACAMAGYGRPMRREYTQPLLPGVTPHDVTPPEVFTWKRIAHIITAHKRVCEIRSCRNASCWPGALRFLPPPPRAFCFPGSQGRLCNTESRDPFTNYDPLGTFIQMTWTSVLRRPSRFIRCIIISISRLARSSTPPPSCTRFSLRTRIAGGSFMHRCPGTRAPRAHLRRRPPCGPSRFYVPSQRASSRACGTLTGARSLTLTGCSAICKSSPFPVQT